jgi:hypothetical protein
MGSLIHFFWASMIMPPAATMITTTAATSANTHVFVWPSIYLLPANRTAAAEFLAMQSRHVRRELARLKAQAPERHRSNTPPHTELLPSQPRQVRRAWRAGICAGKTAIC